MKNDLRTTGKEHETMRTIRVCNNRVEFTDRLNVVSDVTLKDVAEALGVFSDGLLPAFTVCFMNMRTREVTFNGSVTVNDFKLMDQDLLSVCVYYTGHVFPSSYVIT